MTLKWTCWAPGCYAATRPNKHARWPDHIHVHQVGDRWKVTINGKYKSDFRRLSEVKTAIR